MTDLLLQDKETRLAAIDPTRSLIVQAPAGSGKTELLTRRVLALLACVDEPESIVAITFTRKAAAEMRDRILEALREAAAGNTGRTPYREETLALARRAMDRDNARGWGLVENPGRLRIQTIDSLCAAIVRRLPFATRAGAPLEMLDPEDCPLLYREAARRRLAGIEQGGDEARSMAALLMRLDNSFTKVEGLLAGMLAKRDQWLRHMPDPGADLNATRAELERALQGFIERAAEKLEQHLAAAGIGRELIALAAYAAGNIEDAAKSAALAKATTNAADRDALAALARLILTAKNEVRGTVTKRDGFPAGKGAPAEQKARMMDLLGVVAESPELIQVFVDCTCLPLPAYTDEQWQALKVLFHLLPLAHDDLQTLFADRGAVDFIEIARRAADALAHEDARRRISDISHLLVDEFQDTSNSQYELVERLTRDWEPGDGRTLYLVGDPMQSIYRFREAEVGLFIKSVADSRIGSVALERRRLTRNFRSAPVVIDWVNKTFSTVLPAADDMAVGAVSYSPSVAGRTTGKDWAGVHFHAFVAGDSDARAQREAQRVADIAAARYDDPDHSTAILVRSRSHLAAIVPELKRRNLRFQAVDIDPLSDLHVVRDLISLTLAVIHPADRVSWLSILRAPWCGLTLTDLHAVAGAEAPREKGAPRPVESAIALRLTDSAVLGSLSPDGQARARRIAETMTSARAAWAQGQTFRRVVETTWHTLGGAAACPDTASLAAAEVYLEFLGASEEAGDIADIDAFLSGASQLYAPPDPEADGRLQIMTIHKAKGLEFGTVILPGLNKRPQSDKGELLSWIEVPESGADTPQLILSPIPDATDSADPIRDFVKLFQCQKQAFEDQRLLYVGATRAREELHLLASARPSSTRQPPVSVTESTFAGMLLADCTEDWGAEAARAAQQDMPADAEADEDDDSAPDTTAPPGSAPPLIARLRAGWTPPPPAADIASNVFVVQASDASRDEGDPYAGQIPDPFRLDADPSIRHAGTVVHQFLRRIAGEGLDSWPESRVAEARPVILARLRQLGVPPGAQLESAADRALRALTGTLGDERGRWLLGSHPEAASELAISGVVDGRHVFAVIDRTFVDANGVRWVADYKTSFHEGSALDDFLNRRAEHYRRQLDDYAELMAALDGREAGTVRRLIYFPLLHATREWP